MSRSLNIKEPQILINYPNDPTFQWHHRILLRKVTAGQWIALTPDLDLVRHDLTTERHRLCARHQDFPVPAGQIYAHDEISRAELDRFRRLAAMQAMLLSDEPSQDFDSEVWVVSDPTSKQFGTEVPEEAFADALVQTNKGVAIIKDEEVWIERVEAGKLEEWKKTRRDTSRDLRLLGDHRSANGHRVLDLKAAVELFRDTKFDDWPLIGPKVVPEFMHSVVAGAGSLTSYHHEWVRRSGVAEISSAAHEHRILVETFRLATSLDQLDLSNLASFEQLCRRLVQIETAVSPATRTTQVWTWCFLSRHRIAGRRRRGPSTSGSRSG